jgi:predicted molibdopterin-dependent oxidoreductase YjgC
MRKRIEVSLINDDIHEAVSYLLVEHDDRITVQEENGGDSWSEHDWEKALASVARAEKEWLER